jgi:hypothetical protein
MKIQITQNNFVMKLFIIKINDALHIIIKNNWEQECVRYLHNNNINKLKEKSIILPFELLQTFNIDENKDSLIIHISGQSKETRIDIFKKLNENYKIL